MTIVVLVFLALVWAVVLGPTLLRRWAERHATDSIGAFHRQLRILRQTGPGLVPPAHCLGPVQPRTGLVPGSSGLPVISSRRGLIVIRPDAAPSFAAEVQSPRSRYVRPDPYFRAEACKRRRDVFLALGATVAFTAMLGAVLTPLLFVTLVSAVALGTYVVLLVRSRNLALEREAKLHFLPQLAEDDVALPVRRIATR